MLITMTHVLFWKQIKGYVKLINGEINGAFFEGFKNRYLYFVFMKYICMVVNIIAYMVVLKCFILLL